MLKPILLNVIFISSVSSYVIELVASPTFVRLGDDVLPPSLYNGDEIVLKVNVYRSKVIPKKIWCTHNRIFILDTFFKKKGLYYISITNMTATIQMDGEWNCRAFFYNNHEINFDLKATVSTEQYFDAEDFDSSTNKSSDNALNAKTTNTNAGKNYISCSLYMSHGKLHHETKVLLYRDLPFTINVKVGPGVVQRGHLVWIICNKNGKQTEIFVNEPLTNVKGGNGHHYTTKTHLAVGSMEGSWQCKLSIGPNLPIDNYLTIIFDVKFKKLAKTPVSVPGLMNDKKDINEVNPAQSPGIDDSQRNEHVANNDQIVIRFFKDFKGQRSHELKVPSLSLGQNINIAVEDRENTMKFINITCHFILNPRYIFIDSTLKKEKTYRFVSKVIELKKNMSVRWKCYVWSKNEEDKSDHINEIDFDVDFKNTGTDYMHVWVNENRMNVTSNNVANGMYYDSKLSYNYYDGELAKIRCEMINGNHIEAKLIAQNGTQIFKTQPHSNPGHETIYIKLTRDYHASYVDFTVTNLYPRNQTNTVRLQFFMRKQKTDSDELTFIVNDLTLAPNINNEYLYDYYRGETLAILAYTENPRKSWNCNPKPEDSQLQQLLTPSERLNLTVTSDYIKMLPSIDCIVGNEATLLNLKMYNPFDPVINGLSMSQTLLAYQQNQDTYVMTYKNTANSNLKLVCMSNHSGCEWSFKDYEVNAESNPFNFFMNLNLYMSTINLSNYSAESIVINCTCPQDALNKYMHTFSAVIINQMTEESTTIDAGEIAETTTGQTASSSGSTVDNQSLPENGASSGDPPALELKILIGIIIGTLLIVILVIWLIIGLHKRKRKREQAQASDITYENLPEHNEGPMRIPVQWNQYTDPPMEETYTYCEPYVEKNVEEMYAQPQPKNQRQPDTMYADAGALEPTYAAVGQEASRTMYAKANTKEDQKPAYSQIQPKSLRGNAGSAPQVLPKPVNQNYAQVPPKSVRDAQYDNVIKNQRYVNAEAKEYAEPAYCEVAKKK